jgi:hypothetical protein
LKYPKFVYTFVEYLLDMKKLILTENQVKTITNTLIKESVDDTRYRREVKVSVGVNHEQKYKGGEINDISPYSPTMELSFDIDQEHRSWGIKGISLNSIKGPDSIEIEIEYYPEGSDDYLTDEITIPLNWDNVSIDKVSNGLITVGDEVDITLYISETGEYSTEISMDIYTL